MEPSPKGPNRKVYTLTASGREELLEWLRRGPDVGAPPALDRDPRFEGFAIAWPAELVLFGSGTGWDESRFRNARLTIRGRSSISSTSLERFSAAIRHGSQDAGLHVDRRDAGHVPLGPSRRHREGQRIHGLIGRTLVGGGSGRWMTCQETVLASTQSSEPCSNQTRTVFSPGPSPSVHGPTPGHRRERKVQSLAAEAGSTPVDHADRPTLHIHQHDGCVQDITAEVHDRTLHPGHRSR